MLQVHKDQEDRRNGEISYLGLQIKHLNGVMAQRAASNQKFMPNEVARLDALGARKNYLENGGT